MSNEYSAKLIYAPELLSQREAREHLLVAQEKFIRKKIREGATFATLCFFREFPPSIPGYEDYRAVFTFGGRV